MGTEFPMILSLVLFFATPAFADDDTTQSTATGGQENVNAIGSLYAAQQAAEARAAAAERRVTELERRSSSAAVTAPAPTAPAAKPATTPVRPAPVVTTPRPVEPDPDPELVQAKRDLAVAIEAYELAQRQYEAAQADLASATELEVQVRTDIFRPVAYTGLRVAIGPSYEPAFGTLCLEAGVRPAWDMAGETAEFALDLEGNITPVMGVGTGFGVRAIPTYVSSTSAVDLGIGIGPSYDCSVLIPGQGCMAEHIGGLARGSLLVGNGIGVRAHVDLEVNHLTVSDDLEVRTVIGVTVFAGTRRPTLVTIPE